MRQRATPHPSVPEPSRRQRVLWMMPRSSWGATRHLMSFRFKSTADSANLRSKQRHPQNLILMVSKAWDTGEDCAQVGPSWWSCKVENALTEAKNSYTKLLLTFNLIWKTLWYILNFPPLSRHLLHNQPLHLIALEKLIFPETQKLSGLFHIVMASPAYLVGSIFADRFTMRGPIFPRSFFSQPTLGGISEGRRESASSPRSTSRTRLCVALCTPLLVITLRQRTLWLLHCWDLTGTK